MSTNAVVIPQQEEAELSSKAAIAVSRLRAIQVVDADTYEMAANELKGISEWKKRVVDFFAPMKKQAHDLHRTICSRESAVMAPVIAAEDQTRRSLSAWASEQERIRRAEEARLAEEHRKREEEDRRIAAEKAKSMGAPAESVQQILDEPITTPSPVVAPSYERVSGISTFYVWKWRFEGGEKVALKKLIKAAAKDDRLLAFLEVNETALTSAAKSQKDLASVPGIEFYKEATTRVAK